MEGDQCPFENRYHDELSLEDDFFDQSLGLQEIVSRLDLSHHSPQAPLSRRRDFGDWEREFPPLDSSPLSLRANANLQRLSVQSAVNGQSGLGGPHRDPMVGTESRAGSHPTAVSDPRLGGDGASFSSGIRQQHDGNFLQHKKQLGNHLNYRSPIVRSNFSSGSNQHFGGLTNRYALDNLNVSRPNSYDQSQNQNKLMPQYLECFSLGDLKGHILYLAKDQYGSKFLQYKLKNPKEREIEMVLSEVMQHLCELMQHQFGNYVYQRLVEACNENQRTQIILAVTNSRLQFSGLCLNSYGYRAVKKLLNYITCQRQITLLVSAISSGTTALVTDPNGQYLIKHCVEHFSNEDNVYILNEIAQNCYKIATCQSGYSVVQTCVKLSRGEYRDRLVAEIIAYALHLAEDLYGNFVVQHLLELKIPGVTENLLRQFEGRYFSLSCNKYASNVVEKCLVEAGEEQASWIIIELLKSPDVHKLLVDPFGNYVIKKALKVSKPCAPISTGGNSLPSSTA
ncbi:putative pumilio homolog 8, chloroplastic isoform X2 [Actinidia eriantha]|uniref:putative pumilio homolog 8, chloroplastic isoform X2 n=1 Tax=Actinidia eriantha TaxID=165200 RepID=UPI0025900CE5|nr:putative pumilio homolog 8, chloroplastic isoform X2 [Actinidia eriantha]